MSCCRYAKCWNSVYCSLKKLKVFWLMYLFLDLKTENITQRITCWSDNTHFPHGFPLKSLSKFDFLTNAVQPVQGNSLKGPSHHRILLQHLIEVVHRQWVQTTVRVRSDTRRPSASRQQTNLCNKTQHKTDSHVVKFIPETFKFNWE